MEMLIECNTTKGNTEFEVDNYVYEKESVQTNANGTVAIYVSCIKKRSEGWKGSIIIVKNESVYNIKKPCRK